MLGLAAAIMNGLAGAAKAIWQALADMPEDFWYTLKHPLRALTNNSLLRMLGLTAPIPEEPDATGGGPIVTTDKPPIPGSEDAFEPWANKVLELVRWDGLYIEDISSIIPAPMKRWIARESTKSTFGAVIVGLGMAFSGALAKFKSFFTMAAPWIQYGINYEFMPNLLDLPTLVTLGIRHPDQQPIYKHLARMAGWHPALYEQMEETYEAVPDDATLRDWYFRILPQEELSDDQIEKIVQGELRKRGYKDETITRLLASWHWFPNPPDIVRFAVREVFDPWWQENVYNREDAKASDQYYTQARYAGLDETLAKWFWDSHWVLPSAQMGFDMLHRGEIDEGQLDHLLKALDYMPLWRDKVKAIAYRLLTRVDVRRMWRVGTLDDAGVLTAYRRLGYNDTDAKAMADFTIAYETRSMAGKARSAAIATYRAGILSGLDPAVGIATLRNALIAAGYSETEATFEAQAEQVRAQQKRLELDIENIRLHYISGEWDESQALTQLGALRIGEPQTSDYIIKWRLERRAKIRHLGLKEWTEIVQHDPSRYEDAIAVLVAQGYVEDEIRDLMEARGLAPAA